MLWQIENSQTYILGSVHITNMAPPRLPLGAERIYWMARRIVFEADPSSGSDHSITKFSDSQRLSDLISGGLLNRIRQQWIGFNLQEGALEQTLPMYVGMCLQVFQAAKHGYSPQFGIDKHILTKAKTDKKEIVMLEELNDQLKMFATSPLNEQVALLSYIAEKDDLNFSELVNIVDAWRTDNINFFDNLVAERLRLWPKTFEILIGQRNRRWIPRLASMAQDAEPTLVVVGTLHLVGASGIPALLLQSGFKTIRVHEIA